jgi:hypothetical protein
VTVGCFTLATRITCGPSCLEDNHPVSALAAQRADNDEWRQASLNELRRLMKDHSDEVEMTGYHDITELPASAIRGPRG